MTDRSLLALVGPTASGKTDAGIVLAEAFGAEVLSVDSMVIYRGMDVGTAKPTRAQRERVRHHLLDLAEPSEPFSVARYQDAAGEALERIASRGGRGLLVGGAGLYFRAVVDDLEFPGTDPQTRSQLEREAASVGPERLYERLVWLDPVAAGKIEPGNWRRIVRALEVAAITGKAFSSFATAWSTYAADRVRAAGVALPRDILVARIDARVRTMLDAGWLDEVGSLVAGGLGDWLTSTQAIGYAELARHLRGEMSIGDAVEAIVKRTRNLARRQLAWFRRDPRVRWFEAGPEGAIGVVDEIRDYLEAA
jgi:tRNA dimethylallyltransferase